MVLCNVLPREHLSVLVDVLSIGSFKLKCSMPPQLLCCVISVPTQHAIVMLSTLMTGFTYFSLYPWQLCCLSL